MISVTTLFLLIKKYIKYIIFYIVFVFAIIVLSISAPSVDIKNTLSEFVGQEIHKSDRPDLSSANIVISGGKGEKKICFFVSLIQSLCLSIVIKVIFMQQVKLLLPLKNSGGRI